MSYTSISFIAFVIITLLLYFIVPKKARWVILLLASFTFYVINSKWLTLFLILSTAILYGTARWIDSRHNKFKVKKAELEKNERKALKAKMQKGNKWILTLAVISNLAILGVLKYASFFISSANGLLSLFGINTSFDAVSFILPLGISYYTLSGISYITDVYRNTISAEKNPFKLSLFLSYFLQIVEGPFARYNQLGKTLFEGHDFDIYAIQSGAVRLVFGLIKKLVIADRVAAIVAPIFQSPNSFSGSEILVCTLFYTLQIYADFSGCMDIVCGISHMFGVNLAENFNQPFFSRSIDEFWRRWHITLGAFLKDYIFYPISFSHPIKSMSKGAKKHFGDYYGTLLLTSVALFFVWLSNGFWHGSGWKYVVYGMYYFVLMMIGKFVKPVSDRIFSALKINKDSTLWHAFEIIRTTTIVAVGMLIFRADTLSKSLSMLGKVFTDFGGKALFDGSLLCIGDFKLSDLIVSLIGLCFIIAVSVLKERNFNFDDKLKKSKYLSPALLLIMIIILIIFGKYGSGSGSSVFIYGQF